MQGTGHLAHASLECIRWGKERARAERHLEIRLTPDITRMMLSDQNKYKLLVEMVVSIL